MSATLRHLAAVSALAITACTFDQVAIDSPIVGEPLTPVTQIGHAVRALRVWDDPYADVQWATTRRLLVQTHDHAANSSRAILAYDSAGYDVMPLMDYSGVASLPYARRRRLWPADSVVSSTTRAATRSIRTWLPAAEEVGYHHIISLFQTDYIAKWEPSQYAAREEWMYESGQQVIDLIRARGGFPVLAHPWGPAFWTSDLRGYGGIEVYSAFAEQKRLVGMDPFFAGEDRGAQLVEAWDRSLMRGGFVVGFGVNDHYGPDARDSTLSPRVRDSGKSIVLATDTSLAAVRAAVFAGRVFAIRDFSVPKRTYLPIDSIWYQNGVIRVATAGSIRWIADGRSIREGGDSLVVEALPSTLRYVRVEVTSPDGSRVYSQPMRLRPRGDVNGDWRVDSLDSAICRDAGPAPDTRTRRACNARMRDGLL